MPVKQVNHITNLGQYCDGDNFVITIETANPSRPKLFSTCAPVQNYLLEKDTQGTVVPHGIKKWVPQLKLNQDPTICQGNVSVFSGAFGCPPGSPCQWFVAELGSVAPTIEWDSLLHDCACENPADGIALGHHLPAVISVNGVWQQFGFLRQSPQTTLPYNGAEVDLPNHGSFSVTQASIWQTTFPGLPIQTRVVVSNDPNSPYESPPSAADGRACAGNVVRVPRTRITGAGWKVTCQAMGSFHFGVFASTLAPGLFLVDWYND